MAINLALFLNRIGKNSDAIEIKTFKYKIGVTRVEKISDFEIIGLKNLDSCLARKLT